MTMLPSERNRGEAVVSEVYSNLRDKIILGGMILFGVLAFVGIAFGKPAENIVMAIVTGLFGVYRGLPTPPTKTDTTEVTTTSSGGK